MFAMSKGKKVAGANKVHAGLSSPSLALALEPRFMFDAAGVATAAATGAVSEATSHAEADKSTAAADGAVASALSECAGRHRAVRQ